MKKLFLFFLIVFLGLAANNNKPKLLKIFKQFKIPESIEVGLDGAYYVSNIGEFDIRGDGKVSKIINDSIFIFVDGLNDPKGLSFLNGNLYVSDINQIIKINPQGEKSIFIDSLDFPEKPKYLNDIVSDKNGNLYVSDSGIFEKGDGAIYIISPERKVKKVIDHNENEEIFTPNGLQVDRENNLLIVDFDTGNLLKFDFKLKNLKKLGHFVEAGDGLAFDNHGFLYVSDFLNGKIFRLDSGYNSKLIFSGLNSPADINIDKNNNLLLVPELEINEVKIISLY